MAKIRTGFVSNSSSSSFIVAIRKDCTLEDFQRYYKKDAESFLSEYLEDADKKQIEEDFEDMPSKKNKSEWIIESLYRSFSKEKYDNVDLGNWIAYARYASGEELTIDPSSFLYSASIKDEEKLKTASYQ